MEEANALTIGGETLEVRSFKPTDLELSFQQPWYRGTGTYNHETPLGWESQCLSGCREQHRPFALYFNLNASIHSLEFKIADRGTLARGIIFIRHL